MRQPGKEIKQCHSLPVGHGWNMIDQTAWQRNNPVSPTACLSWNETWLMRLPGKELKWCHSHSVGHGMKHDWWDCLAKKWSNVAHNLLVMGLMRLSGKEIKQCHSHTVDHGMKHDLAGKEIKQCHALTVSHEMKYINETVWYRNKAMSLTYCYETWLMRLPGKETKQCHLLAVGHGMKHDWWSSLAKK